MIFYALEWFWLVLACAPTGDGDKLVRLPSLFSVIFLLGSEYTNFFLIYSMCF